MGGGDRGRRGGDSFAESLQRFDAFPKVNEDFFQRTLAGGVITLVATAVMLVLFVSEFGAVAWSSPESLASTLSPRYRSLFGGTAPAVCAGDGFPNICKGSNVLARRNYPCANFVGSFFGGSADYLRPGSTPPALVAYLNATRHFASSLYLCGLASALLVKNLVEGCVEINQCVVCSVERG